MRNSDEMLSEIMRRAESVRTNRRRRNRVRIDLAGILLSVVLMVLVIRKLPTPGTLSPEIGEQHYGSLILSNQHIGFVMIGILAFALGVFVTLLCLHLRRGK